MKLPFKKLSHKMKVKLSIFVVFAFIIALVIHEDHAGVVLRNFKPKRGSKVVNSSISAKPVPKAKVIWEEVTERSMIKNSTDNVTAMKTNEVLLNSSVVYYATNETVVKTNKVLFNSSVVYLATNETVVKTSEVLLNSSVVYGDTNKAISRKKSSRKLSVEKEYRGHNCSKFFEGRKQNCSQLSKNSNISSNENENNSPHGVIQESSQKSKTAGVSDEKHSSDSILNKTVQQQNEQRSLEFEDVSDNPTEDLASKPNSSKFTNSIAEEFQESNLTNNSKEKVEVSQKKDISENDFSKNNVHLNKGEILGESLETLVVSSTTASSFEKPVNETDGKLEMLSKVVMTANLKSDITNATLLNLTSSTASSFTKSVNETDGLSKGDKAADLASDTTNEAHLNQESPIKKSVDEPDGLSKGEMAVNVASDTTNEAHLNQTSVIEKSVKETDGLSKEDMAAADDLESDTSTETPLNKASSITPSFKKSINETGGHSKDDMAADLKSETTIENLWNQTSPNAPSLKKSATEELSKDMTADLISDITNETLLNQTGLESIVSAGLEFLANSEVAKNAMDIFNLSDTSLTDHIIEDSDGVIELVSSNEIKDTTINKINETTVEQDSAEANDKKCPPPGICVFWFMTRHTCNSDDQCLDSKICCRIRCSKQCINV